MKSENMKASSEKSAKMTASIKTPVKIPSKSPSTEKSVKTQSAPASPESVSVSMIKTPPKPEFHLKGGCGVHAIRWTYVGFCFVLFVLSVTLLIISAVNYAELRVAFDEVQSRKNYDFNPNRVFHQFKPEPALALFYLGMTLGTIFTVISCIGAIGAACLNRCFLLAYVISLSVVIFGSVIALTVITNIYKDDLKIAANQVFTEYVTHMYGRNEYMAAIVRGAVDTIHKKYHCCGILPYKGRNETIKKLGTTPAHWTILYWLESTQWGQMQADHVGYEKDAKLPFVPESCCLKRTDGCSIGTYRDRLFWDETKERAWTQKIHVVGCGDHLLNFQLLKPSDRAKVVAIAAIVIILMLATIVVACWLCQSLGIYEFSSQGSELEQRRHRRRHRRRRLHRLKLRRFMVRKPSRRKRTRDTLRDVEDPKSGKDRSSDEILIDDRPDTKTTSVKVISELNVVKDPKTPKLNVISELKTSDSKKETSELSKESTKGVNESAKESMKTAIESGKELKKSAIEPAKKATIVSAKDTVMKKLVVEVSKKA